MTGAIAIGAMAVVSGQQSSSAVPLLPTRWRRDFLTNNRTCFSAAMNPVMNMNIPSQPLATHCFQLANMFSPNRYTHTPV